MSEESIEFLVRLNAKGVDTTSAGRSSVISIDNAHLNAACSGTSDLAQALIDARIKGDKKQLDRLLREEWVVNPKTKIVVQTNGLYNKLFNMVLDLSAERKWQNSDKGKDRLRQLTRLAIVQVVDSPPCKACNGTRFVELVRTCSSCKGTGKKRLNGVRIAKDLSMDESNWRRTWHPRYCDIVSMIQTLMHDAARKIRYKTYGN